MSIDFHQLLKEFPEKETAQIIAQGVARQPSQIEKLWQLAKGDDKISWRAAWIMDKVYDLKPEIIRPYIPEMIKLSLQKISDSQLRQFLKLISMNPLPQAALDGNFLEACFQWLSSEKTPVAIRVYAMQILYNFSLLEPDISNEIACTIEELMDRGSAGFKSRGRKILKALNANH